MDRKKFIKKYIAIFIIAIIAIIILSIMIKYNVEGETNLPFEISKIMIISTAGGNQKENSEYKWNLNLFQSNDIYINIIKNKNYSQEEIIDKVIFSNFKIENAPIKGEIELYRPNQNGIFNNKEEYKIEDKLIFIGDELSNLENLRIANQGGLLLLRIINNNIGIYSSNDEEEIRHDGTLLKKIGLSNEEIKFNISFDIWIELKSGKKFKATQELQMPTGNLIQEGTTTYQINGNEIVFKR